MEHKMHIASAVSQNGGYSRPNMSNHGLVTAKIGQILPVWMYPTVPGDKVTVRHNQFARFLPLNVPSYVDLTYRTMTVFVPYHQVMDGAESFFANQNRFKGQYNSLPYISNSDFKTFFSLISTTTNATSSNFDYVTVSGSTKQYRLFTSEGRYIVKLLRLLGYGWYRGENDATITHVLQFPSVSNALPLLAFAHAYNCYLSYSARYNTSALSATLESIKRRSQQTNTISSSQLQIILTSILLTYEESFFSSLWREPYSSGDRTVTEFNSLDLEDTKFYQLGGEVGVSWQQNYGGMTDYPETASQIRLAMRFDDYFRRTAYGGSKDVQQIYSRFGVKIDDYRTRYPYFLGESAQQVRIGDVTSTSDTESAPVGAYAGKAISDGSQKFEFNANDYGCLFTFAWFAPRPTYYTGVEPEILRTKVFDFYTPELDQGFAVGVPRELMNIDYHDVIGSTMGYAPAYSDYLYARDYIVGDFTRFAGMESWHFGRTPDKLTNMSAQDDGLIYLPQGGSEFERIFNVYDTSLVDADSIYMDVRNEVHATRPMKDRSGKAMLGDGAIDLPNMGSQVN